MNNFTRLRTELVNLMLVYADNGLDIVEIHAAIASAEMEARVALQRALDARQRQAISEENGEDNG